MGWVVNATTRPLYPREWPGTHCTVGCSGAKYQLLNAILQAKLLYSFRSFHSHTTVLSYRGVVCLLYVLYFKMSCVYCCELSCVYCCELSCVYCCSCLVYIVVILCVFVVLFFFILYAGLLARSQYS
jgi:hypothetical protein